MSNKLDAATKKAQAAPAAKNAAKLAAKPAAKAAAKVARKAPVKQAAKPVAKPAAAPAAKVSAEKAVAKPAKIKLVRDSFTMPSDEYAAIDVLKQRALAFSQPAKKSELLRAGIKLLSGLSDAALQRTLKTVPSIKTGRPKGKKAD